MARLLSDSTSLPPATDRITGRAIWGNGGFRFPHKNGANSKAAAGRIIINNSVSAIRSFGFDRPGFIGFRFRFPLLQDTIFRRARRFVGTTSSRSGGNSLSIGWQGMDGADQQSGLTDKQNRVLFKQMVTGIPELWSAEVPPTRAVLLSTTDLNGTVCTYPPPFPPSFNDNGDCPMDMFCMVALETGAQMRVRLYDIWGGITYHGPLVSYSGTGATTIAENIILGGTDNATFPPTIGETGFDTSMLGEMGEFMISDVLPTDAQVFAYLREGATLASMIGANPILYIPFHDGAGSFSSNVVWNGGTHILGGTTGFQTGYVVGETVYQTATGVRTDPHIAEGVIVRLGPSATQLVVRTTMGTFVNTPTASRPLFSATNPAQGAAASNALQAMPAPTITVQGEILPASTYRPVSATKSMRVKPLKDPCLLPVKVGAKAAELYREGTTTGIPDGAHVRFQTIDGKGTVLQPWRTFCRVASNAFSGFADIEDRLSHSHVQWQIVSYSAAGVQELASWTDMARVVTVAAGLLDGQSQCDYITDIGTSRLGLNAGDGADSTAGTTAIPTAGLVSDALNHVWFITKAGNGPTSAGQPVPYHGIIGGGVTDLNALGARRIKIAETLFKRRPGNYVIIEDVLAGTGEMQQMADTQADLASWSTQSAMPSAYERMWSDLERALGCLGSVNRRGLYPVSASIPYWGSALNASDYDAKMDAVEHGIPSLTASPIDYALINRHHRRDGKTLDPDFKSVIMPFPRSTGATLGMDGDTGSRGAMSDSQRAWAMQSPDTRFYGPNTDVYYLQGWNPTKLNPGLGVTHSQLDLTLGSLFVAEMFAESFLRPYGMSGYKGYATPAFIELYPSLAANKRVRFLDNTRKAIIVPVQGPYYERLLGRMIERLSPNVNPVGLPVWGFEYGSTASGTFTPVKLLSSIYDRRNFILTLSDDSAFPAATWIKFHPGGPGTYNFSAQQALFVTSTGTRHALADYWCEEYFVAWAPTWGGFLLDAVRDSTKSFAVGAPA